MSKLKAYDSYQPVQYDYVAEIPEGWQLLPNLAIFQERIERGHEDKELLSVTIGRGVIKQSELDKKDSSTLDKSKYLLVYPDDLVYSMRFRQGASGYSIYKGIVSPACTVLRPKKGTKINPRYFYYMFRTGFYKNYVERYAYGIADGQIPLRYVDFKRMYSIVPPLATQNAIVAYLDRKTQQIQAFIQKKERLIELLEEEKLRVIKKHITKGINCNHFTNSAELWLGDVPTHWEVKIIKRCCQVKRGASPRPIDDPIYFDDNGEYGWVRISDVTSSEKYLEKTEQFLSRTGDKKSVKMNPGDMFLSIAGSVGKPIITNIKCCIHDGFVWFENLKHVKKEFLYYIFLNGECFGGLGKIGTQLNLNTDTVGMISIPVPPHKEQDLILSSIRIAEQRINRAISKAKSEIEKAKEYQESLITQVVTGQLKVPTLTHEKVMN